MTAGMIDVEPLAASLRRFAAALVAGANGRGRPYDPDRLCDEAVIAFLAYLSAAQFSRLGLYRDWRAAVRREVRVALLAPPPQCR